MAVDIYKALKCDCTTVETSKTSQPALTLPDMQLSERRKPKLVWFRGTEWQVSMFSLTVRILVQCEDETKPSVTISKHETK